MVRPARRRSLSNITAMVATALLAAGGLAASPSAPGGASGTADRIGASPPARVRPCPGLDGVLCGSIRVPLYRGLPDGGGQSLTVRFREYLHTDGSRPGLEPLVGMEGGPGYGAIASASTYLFLLGHLHARHDLIVMDQRGTGSSDPIACPAVQFGRGDYVDAVGACARTLGIAANAYGTGAVADDLADILRALHTPPVDVYGDSYGTYAAQSFAFRHPSMVRALVLDGAYNNSFDPFEREASASLRHAWRGACARAPRCPESDILGAIGRWDERFGVRPLVGVARDADGARHRIRMDAVAFAQLVADGTYVYTTFRDLPAAMRALDRGDRAPMLRLAAEDAASTAPGGSPSDYSAGDGAAVSCHDYRTIWDPGASLRRRRAQLKMAVGRLDPDVFAPFAKGTWLRSLYEYQLVAGCLKWPVPPVADPPFPPGVPAPDVPVLVLNGEFDQSTPVADAAAAARSFPNSNFVMVPNTVHITAEADYQRCASVLARRFLATLSSGDTSCTASMPAAPMVATFPRSVARAPRARPAGPADHSTAIDRRVAWVTTQEVGDAFDRWYNDMYGTVGHGLYGGRFLVAGPYLSDGPLGLRFRDARFVPDLAVSGRAVWNRESLMVRADVRVLGPGGHRGALSITWPTNVAHAAATIRGTLDGRTVRLAMPAPWAPLG